MSGRILLGIPHGGLRRPPGLQVSWRDGVNGEFLRRQSDAYSAELYKELGVDSVCFEWSRLVVDPNRSPSSRGRGGVVPRVDFDNRPLYRQGHEPTEQLIAERVATYHAPYHQAIAARLASGRYALFVDGHAMAAVGPARSPDGAAPRPLAIVGNGGDAAGEMAPDARPLSCPPALARTAARRLEEALRAHPSPAAPGYVASEGEVWLNRVFRGGYGVRHHGALGDGPYALQLELNQGLWCHPETFTLHEQRLEWMRSVIRSWLRALENDMGA